jgi:hypothetical protein
MRMTGAALIQPAAFASGAEPARGDNNGTCNAVTVVSLPECAVTVRKPLSCNGLLIRAVAR